LPLVTIGPAAPAKRTGIIIPNLSTLRRSILIIDPQAKRRRSPPAKRAQFGPVIVINPFNVFAKELPHLKSSGFNPLAALDPEHDDFTDDCTESGKRSSGNRLDRTMLSYRLRTGLDNGPRHA